MFLRLRAVFQFPVARLRTLLSCLLMKTCLSNRHCLTCVVWDLIHYQKCRLIVPSPWKKMLRKFVSLGLVCPGLQLMTLRRVTCESSFVEPGEEIVVTETPLGRIGQATCYDLRFPELFRGLVDRGAEIIVVPSAFTQSTGRDHWEVLLRARAIENQVFVVAANQHGVHAPGITTYGRSMVIDPWGTVLATAPDGEAVVTAELDFDRQREIRATLPALKHRRVRHSS